MINEFAAKSLIHLGLKKAAEGYLRYAHYLYYKWGALRKVKDMESQYSILKNSGRILEDRTTPASVINHDTFNSSSFDSNLLDITSLFKASQSLSGELNLQKLLVSTLQILIENAGAQRAYLIEKMDDNIVIRAMMNHDFDSDKIKDLDTDSENNNSFPITLVNTVFRTNETIVINNASEVNQFSSDPYIHNKKPLSIMCIPLPRYGEMQAAGLL